MHRQVGTFGKVLAQQAIGVLIRTAPRKGVSSGLAMPHILVGVSPTRVTASHGPGIEPCSQSGDRLIDA